MKDTSDRGRGARAGGRPSRRALLGGGITAAAAAAGLTGCGPAGVVTSVRAPRPATSEPPRTGVSPLVLQILAHPDDDLYFMNPDTLNDLRSGVPVVSVYVTAGDSTGVNHEPWEPRGTHHRHDIPAYSSARHQGLRQAYATMLGLPHFTPWHREVISPRPGGGSPYAEVDTLATGRTHATLVFLQVSMHETGPAASLPLMWSRPGVALPYIVAEGAPAPADQPAVWTHTTLVDALAGLMDLYRPTVIRTLDPDPDIQVHDRAHPRNSDQPGYSDHRDHTAAALFAWKAMDRWTSAATARDGVAPAFTTTVYRGYYNQRWPFNLPPATVALKERFLFQYGGDQRWACGNPGGCGDYGQGRGQPVHNRKGWIRSTHRRYPASLADSVTGPPGRRTAYQVLGNGLVRRAETAPGVWGPPQRLGGGPLAPAVCAVEPAAGGRTGNGTAGGGGDLVFALRFAALEGHGGRNARDVVLWQDGRWTSLGNPEATDDRGRRIGAPTALRTADGRLHLFVRNADKGLSTRVLAGGSWGPWQDLGGGEVQEGLAVLTDRADRVHVFGAGHDAIHHWAQATPADPPRPQPRLTWPRPGDHPTAVPTPDGTIDLAYPLPASPRTFHATLTP